MKDCRAQEEPRERAGAVACREAGELVLLSKIKWLGCLNENLYQGLLGLCKKVHLDHKYVMC